MSPDCVLSTPTSHVESPHSVGEGPALPSAKHEAAGTVHTVSLCKDTAAWAGSRGMEEDVLFHHFVTGEFKLTFYMQSKETANAAACIQFPNEEN